MKNKSNVPFLYILMLLFRKLSDLDYLLFPLVIIGIGFSAMSFIKNGNSIFNNDYLLEGIPFIVAILFFIIQLLFKFLNNDNEKKSESISAYLLRKEYIDKSKRVEDSIKEVLDKNPDLINVEKIIYDKILSNLENSLINKLDDRFKDNIKTEYVSNSIQEELKPLTNNLERYLDRIQRNSIVNLFIGILGTITAVLVLAFAILSNKSFTNMELFFIHFLPRLTFVVFIQLFAFFFLRLYKSNLEDAKYFQNELTNLTAKSTSIKISYLVGNTEKVAEILKELSVTERNFKLLKDETTIGLEKAKLESEIDKSIMNQIKELLSKIESR